jgi:hypothetical protein
VYLWLDANDDGYFDASERIFTSTVPSTVFPKVGTFTIPLVAVRNHPLRLRLVWHAIRQDDFITPWPAPDPQTRDEDYDQIRDFTVWVSGTPLATTPSFSGKGSPTWAYYPNPAQDWILLTHVPEPQEMQLLNSLGQVVQQVQLHPANDNTCRVELPNLPSGIYLLRMTKDGSTRRILLRQP